MTCCSDERVIHLIPCSDFVSLNGISLNSLKVGVFCEGAVIQNDGGAAITEECEMFNL